MTNRTDGLDAAGVAKTEPTLQDKWEAIIASADRQNIAVVPKEPTRGMLAAGHAAYCRKADDAFSQSPTEHPDEGGGPLGYAYRAMVDAGVERVVRSALVDAPAGETRKPKQYCQCKSLTNPCIVCGLPKFIDPTWLKRKIEEDGEEGEIGAGFEMFASPTPSVAAPQAEIDRLKADIETFWKPKFDEQCLRAEAAEAERDNHLEELGRVIMACPPGYRAGPKASDGVKKLRADFEAALVPPEKEGEAQPEHDVIVSAADEAQMALCQLDWLSSLQKAHPHRIDVIRLALERLARSGASPRPAVSEAMVEAAARELWDAATNSVCQTMQERDMCKCPDGDCLASKINPDAKDIAWRHTSLTAALGSVPGKGWQLVPVKPTPEMLGAWYRYKNGHHWADEPPPRDTSDYGAYAAMLAASLAPSDPSSQGSGR